MRKGGRISSASLMVVKTGICSVDRPDPPAELSDDEAHEWRCVVDRMPADWFPRETHPLLIQFCRHTVIARHLAQLIKACESERELDMRQYGELLKLHANEGRAMSSLATRMRVSQHAQYNIQKKTGSSIEKPWK